MVLHGLNDGVQRGIYIQITENLIGRHALDRGDLLTIFAKDALCATKKMGDLIRLDQKRKDLGIVFVNQILQFLFGEGDERRENFIALRPNLRTVFCKDIGDGSFVFS